MAIIDNIQAAKDAVINNDGVRRTTEALSTATNAAIDSLANFEIDNLNNQGLSFDAFGDVVNTASDALNNLAGVAGELASATSSAQNQLNSSLTNDTATGVDNATNVPSTTLTVNQNSVANINTANASGMLGTANRLHNYASYTYRLSLFMLSRDDYHKISDSPESFTPRNAIVSGAGKNVATTDSGTKHPEFNDDFYFEELKIQTMVGMNRASKSSNILELNFTIVEPYGMTFLDRLLIATKGIGSKNYTDMPYLMQIEFFGHKDDGTTDFLPIPGTLKRFPIRILALSIDVGTNGATYKVSASPYNNGAFDDNLATAGVNLQVNGNTVGKFFNDTGVANIGAAVQGAKEARGDFSDFAPPIKVSSVQVSVDSFTAGLNGWFEYQKEEGARKHPDVILFSIDPAIANSKILRTNIVPPKKTQMAKPGTTQASQVAGGAPIGGDPNRKDWVINAGTTVQKVIDQVIRASDYVHNQIADPNDPKWAGKSSQQIADELKKPLQWYKVVPSIRLGEFDEKANRFAKIITYHIKTYTVYDSKHPLGPSKKPTTWQKEYNYLYTGQNVDILDFKIEFNALFYQLISINRSSQQTSEVNASGKKEATSMDLPTGKTGNNALQEERREIKGSDGNNAESKTQTIDDIQKNLYSNAKADMINITLDIVGDPDFIKQDDVYINPSQGTYEANTKTENGQIGGNGSLVMDRGELFAKIKFRTPVDRSLETGLLREDGRYRESNFSGVYRILGVMNTFQGGQFKQNIDLIRCYDLEEKAGESISGERGKEATQTPKDKAAPIADSKPIDAGNNQSVTTGVDEFAEIGNQSGITQQAAQAAGGGLGILSDRVADAATAFSGGPLDLGRAVSGAVDELSGAVGLSLSSTDIGALVSAGSEIVQGGLNLANSFAEGVGVTGAQFDLAQIANDANEFASLADERIRRSTNGSIDNSNSIFT